MTASKSLIEPLVALWIDSPTGIFQPGQPLVCEYQIDAIDPADIQAVEASVMWYTEGKGDEDLGVHFFERNTPSDAVDGDLRQLHRFETVLPPSPCSYDGAILKICWSVRVRLFWGRGRQAFADRPFQLLYR